MWPPCLRRATQGGHIGPPLQGYLGRVLVLFLGLAAPGLATTSPIRVLSATGIGIESAALLMSGQEGGEIPLGAVALPIRGEAGKTRILMRLRIDGPALLAGQTADVLRAEVALYALDGGQGVQASLLETIELDLPSLRDAIQRGGVDFLGGLELRPGQYSVRMLARNLETGKLVVRTLPLTVPDPATLDASPGLSPPPAEGDPRVTARSGSLGPLDPPPFPDDAAAPARIAAPAAERDVPAPPRLPDTAEGRKLRAAVRTAYREALAQLSGGHEGAALAQVAALEDSLLRRTENPLSVDDVTEIEAAAGEELAGKDPEVLLPLLRFHQRLHEEATVKRRLQGSSVAREVFLRLVDRYREHGRPELARLFQSTFGVELLFAGVRSQGERLLKQVAAEDPGNDIALLELAADAERLGARDVAAGYLEELLRAHPDHGEARLRRALDLGRLGKKAEAEEALKELLRDDHESWRLRLAYQELARMQRSNDPAAAEKTLREGLARLPSDEKLTLLLAAIRERTAGPAAAREVLAALKPEGNAGGGAARNRYNLLPEEPLRTALAELDREAAARLPKLGAALERTGK
jgi:tetratricopeptide (TPR) repeat protein